MIPFDGIVISILLSKATNSFNDIPTTSFFYYVMKTPEISCIASDTFNIDNSSELILQERHYGRSTVSPRRANQAWKGASSQSQRQNLERARGALPKVRARDQRESGQTEHLVSRFVHAVNDLQRGTRGGEDRREIQRHARERGGSARAQKRT